MKNFFTLLLVSLFLLIAGKSFTQSDYKGIVKYNDAARTPVKSVIVKLHDTFGNLISTETTDGSGKYTFKNIPAGIYTLSYSGYTTGAKVNSADVRKLVARLFGVVRFDEIQELAADVNEDGKVNWGDFGAIVTDYFVFGKKHAIGKIVAQSKKIEISGMSLKDGDVGSIGSGGDFEGAFEPSTKTTPMDVKIQYGKSINVNSNELIEMPVYLRNQPTIGGFVVSFNIPEGIYIEDLSSQLDGIQFNQSNGILKVIWQDKTISGAVLNANEPLFTLKVNSSSIDHTMEIENISLNKESHFVDLDGNELKDAQISLPSFSGIDQQNELNNIYPNPIYNTATINYSLASSYKVSLQIYNTVGQLVTNLVDEEQTTGSYEVKFNRSNLHLSAGSYIYRLECKGENSFVQSKIMIIR